MTSGPSRFPSPFKCEFCGQELEDLMLAFMDHVDASPSCKALWDYWRENVRRESGGT